jgi:hypothetical protein
MSRRMRHILIQVALSILVIILIPQFIYDPLQLRGFDDVYRLAETFECANEDCSLLLLPEGEMRFGWRWSVTINPDGSRPVPDNSPTCAVKIAGIGDSFTWGPGVADDETWLNRLAQHFTGVCFYNYGQWGYNIDEVAKTLETRVPQDMDYVLYFIFQDDDRGSYGLHEPEAPPNPLIAVRYVQLFAWRQGWYQHSGWGEEGQRYPENFSEKIRQMAADPRVRFAGFEEEILAYRVENELGYPVFGIPLIPPQAQMSPIDQHPNAEGYRLMAESLYPLIEELLEQGKAGG